MTILLDTDKGIFKRIRLKSFCLRLRERNLLNGMVLPEECTLKKSKCVRAPGVLMRSAFSKLCRLVYKRLETPPPPPSLCVLFGDSVGVHVGKSGRIGSRGGKGVSGAVVGS